MKHYLGTINTALVGQPEERTSLVWDELDASIIAYIGRDPNVTNHVEYCVHSIEEARDIVNYLYRDQVWNLETWK